MAKGDPTGAEGAKFDGLSALHAFETGEGITSRPYWAPLVPGTGAAPDPRERLIEITGDEALVDGDREVLRARIYKLFDQ